MTVFLPSITVAVVTATPPSILDILLFLSFLLARPSQNVFYYTIYPLQVVRRPLPGIRIQVESLRMASFTSQMRQILDILLCSHFCRLGHRKMSSTTPHSIYVLSFESCTTDIQVQVKRVCVWSALILR